MAQHNPVDSKALKTPFTTALKDRRVILASSSPRRKELLARFGITPEIVPSDFDETLAKGDYAGHPAEYAKATAEEKALDVYIKLVQEYPDDPPDMVIGADTVVILEDEIMEKPGTKGAAKQMLSELNGRRHDVVTGVAIVVPTIQTPGYSVKSFYETTMVHFADNSDIVLDAYIDSEEGLDRAGGYAIQEQGGILVKEIQGDFNNVMGFPCQAFFNFCSELLDEEELFEID